MPRQTNIQIRRGASASWNVSAEVLEAGELGWDTDNKILKIGNGFTWDSTNPILPNHSKYKTLIGDGVETSFTINHGLNASTETFVSVRNNSGEYVSPDIKYVDADSILLEFLTAPSVDEYLVSIIGINGISDVTTKTNNFSSSITDISSSNTGISSTQITGIDRPILLKVDSISNSDCTIYYKTSVSSFSSSTTHTDLTNNWTEITESETKIKVSNNEYVGFAGIVESASSYTTFSVKNFSDNNLSLKTIGIAGPLG